MRDLGYPQYYPELADFFDDNLMAPSPKDFLHDDRGTAYKLPRQREVESARNLYQNLRASLPLWQLLYMYIPCEKMVRMSAQDCCSAKIRLLITSCQYPGRASGCFFGRIRHVHYQARCELSSLRAKLQRCRNSKTSNQGFENILDPKGLVLSSECAQDVLLDTSNGTGVCTTRIYLWGAFLDHGLLEILAGALTCKGFKSQSISETLPPQT